MNTPGFTGRVRQRKTSPRVFWVDHIARVLIMFGGIGTIVAVLTVFIFLGSVIVPLFRGSSIESAGRTQQATPWQARPIATQIDEYQVMGWALFNDGRLEVFRGDTGKILAQRQLISPTQAGGITAWSVASRRGDLVLGFGDGSLRLGRISFATDFITANLIPEELREQMRQGQTVEFEGGVVQRTNEGAYRRQTLHIELQDPVESGNRSAIIKVDQSIRPTGPIIAALTADGRLLIKSLVSRRNMVTGKVTTRLTGGEVAIEKHGQKASPDYMLFAGVADTLYLIWDDGRLVRYDTRQYEKPQVAEVLQLLPQADARISAAEFMIGKTSLVVGDSKGRISTWFPIKPAGATTVDGVNLVQAHFMSHPENSAVTALAISARSRMIAAGFDDGSVQLYQVTTQQMLGTGQVTDNKPVISLTLAPKDDGVFAVTPDHFYRWNILAPHPETTFAAIFLPVWYEGYVEPGHTWQSSSGEDAFEPKYGLFPLIFGTLKATVYSMLFGLPLALLAAVFTSEFLHPRVKARVKPTIELMASLPSVVLGFLAALVIAPLIEDIVPQVLAAFVTIPFTLVLGAHLWQMLPVQTRIRLQQFERPVAPQASGLWSWWHGLLGLLGGVRPLLMLFCMPVALLLASGLGPTTEHMLFAGNIKAWLDGQIGSGAGAWLFLLLPVSALIVAVLVNRLVTTPTKSLVRDWSHHKLATWQLGKFLLGCVATVILALVLSHLFNTLLWDPRGSFVGTYIQRNAMIVGFVMGFAIIPIIYTISEDALSSVPEHLRAASLAAGATPWQTAMRIIVPTAASGLFSAAMIGLGRAVGETMIVLMAAGNTPVLEWNIFNGFRTLSANIAVELPEAVKDSTHYRMLFLAGFVLFVMTFLLNTVAEVVRQRFRKRAFQL